MPINNKIVSNTGTEIDFISEFITELMNESAFTSQQHSLVCKINTSNDISTAQEVTAANVSTKVSGVFDNSRSSTVNIWFTIDSYTTVRMERGAPNDSTVSAYRFYLSFNGVAEAQPRATINFCIGTGTPYSYNTKERTFVYQIVSNANAIFIVFGGASTDINFPLVETQYYPCASIFSYAKTVNGNIVFVCGRSVADTLTGTGGQSLKAVNRLAYNNSTSSTAIETIQNKIVVTSVGNQKAVTMDNIWDSTYNAVVMNSVNVIVNNQSTECVYLNNYTVMPI